MHAMANVMNASFVFCVKNLIKNNGTSAIISGDDSAPIVISVACGRMAGFFSDSIGRCCTNSVLQCGRLVR